MGFIDEAEIMLQHAREAGGSANKALRVGWLTLAKDTVSAAITEAKKGIKAQDGHVVGQMSIGDADKPRGRKRSTVKADENGVVTTPADEAQRDLDAEPSQEPPVVDRSWNDIGVDDPLPDETALDAQEQPAPA
jgi:hypothetical protein